MMRTQSFRLACAILSILLTDLALAQTAPARSWTWPKIPVCLADPGLKTPGETDYTSPICPLYQQLLASGANDIELISARRLNAEMDGVLYPAFLPGTEAVRFIVAGNFNQSFREASGFVRVSTSAAGARNGSWWTTLASVSENGHLLKADAIRARLALTDTPSCIAYAEIVRTGVRGYMGVIAPAFDQPGGAVEFWFPPSAVIAGNVSKIPGEPECKGL